MNYYAIIVAGGSGTRMGAAIPKQFLLLNNKPVLMHTLERFFNYNNHLKIILVLPDNQKDYWAKLCIDHSFTIPHQIVSGGSTRFESVQNGLQAITETTKAMVAVHDGVRPLVSYETLERCFAHATTFGNAIPFIPLNDSIRKVENGGSQHVNRNDYKAIQTPQVFDLEIIKTAYQQAFIDLFTDDASVVESTGVAINLVDGNIENIKITTPFDIILAEALLNKA